jgi:hypothetical protein
MFSSELEDSDRLVNVVLGRLSKELDGFSWMLEKKTGLFLDIGLNDFVGFSAFRKKEKLIDTGFFCLVYQDLGLVTYWTVWFFWILTIV